MSGDRRTAACGESMKSAPPPGDWIARWQRIARRIRVPLSFLVAALYLFELWRRPSHPSAIGWSLLLTLPGLALRGYASGYVKKDRELTVTGPYAYSRNPLYLGSMLIAAGFAVALLSWLLAVVLAVGFAIIYIPVIASEERFLRDAFPVFEEYCRRVPRLLPRLTPAKWMGTGAEAGPPSHIGGQTGAPVSSRRSQEWISASRGGESSSSLRRKSGAGYSPALYLRHREYNAVIGAALLYLSLLFLRPMVEAILRAAR